MLINIRPVWKMEDKYVDIMLHAHSTTINLGWLTKPEAESLLEAFKYASEELEEFIEKAVTP